MSGCSHEMLDAFPDKNLRCQDCGVEGEFVPMDEIRLTLRELAARTKVIEAVYVKGPNPAHHDALMARHRREWPTLWAAIDRLITAGDTQQLDG